MAGGKQATRCQQKKSSRELRSCCLEVTMAAILVVQKREAKREIQGKHYIGLSECTKNVVGTTKAVHEFCGALKRGAKATGREVTRHGHRAVDRGRPTSGGPVRSTGRTAFFPSHSVPMGPPFLTGRTSKFLPESNGPARLTMAVLGRPPGAPGASAAAGE